MDGVTNGMDGRVGAACQDGHGEQQPGLVCGNKLKQIVTLSQTGMSNANVAIKLQREFRDSALKPVQAPMIKVETFKICCKLKKGKFSL